jgi:dihydrofolate reductase
MDDTIPFDFRAYHAQFKTAMIVACSENSVIGADGDLPWHLPTDLKHFMRSTKQCPVIMGRKTFDSLEKPLPNRLNIVLSRSKNPERTDGVLVYTELDDAIRSAQSAISETGLDGPVWIAGGGHIYSQAMDIAELIVRTRVHSEVVGDTYFPEIELDQWACDRSQVFEPDARHAYRMTIEWWVRRAVESDYKQNPNCN